MFFRPEEKLPPNVHNAYSVDEMIVRDWVMEKGHIEKGSVDATHIANLEDGRQKWTIRGFFIVIPLDLYEIILTKEEIAEIIKTYGTWKKRLKYHCLHIWQNIEVWLIVPPFLIAIGIGSLIDKLRKQE